MEGKKTLQLYEENPTPIAFSAIGLELFQNHTIPRHLQVSFLCVLCPMVVNGEYQKKMKRDYGSFCISLLSKLGKWYDSFQDFPD